MFRRLLFEDYTAVCVCVAFFVAAGIYLAISWRALRMSREQVEHLANLPFSADTAITRHDDRA